MSTLTRDEFLQCLKAVNTWQRGDTRAPHKPLLMLYALGRFRASGDTRVRFSEITADVGQLLEEFGPARRKSALYPYYYLATDGLWDHGIPPDLKPRRGEPRKRDLLAHDVAGGFTPDVLELLRRHPDLVDVAARDLVTTHFPATIQDDVLNAVGISLEGDRRDRRRDPRFREVVLLAYQYRCAACGLDLALGREPVALEAAHVKWVQAGGPDVTTNGLALCVLHHKLFDLGGWRLAPDGRILVSDRIRGSGSPAQWLLGIHGAYASEPVHADQAPASAYLDWHRREVFKGRERPLA